MNEETKVTVRSGGAFAGAAGSSSDAAWRRYPHLDRTLETGTPTVLASIEKTCRELERLIQAGTDRDRERARRALVAYQRALELYHRLTDLREEALTTASNMRSRSAISK
jgi:hypothetical protein